MKTYYEILGIPSNANKDEIKASYNKLVLAWHPDKNSKPEAPEVFREIQQAYKTLKDPLARQLYDNEIQIPSFEANQISPIEQLIKSIIEDEDNLVNMDNETYLQEVLDKFINLAIQEYSPIEFLLKLAEAFHECDCYKEAAIILTDILEKKSYILKSHTKTGIEADKFYAKAHDMLAYSYYKVYDASLNCFDSEEESSEEDSSDEELTDNEAIETLAIQELILEHWECAIKYNGEVAENAKIMLTIFINEWNENAQDSDTEETSSHSNSTINEHNFESSYLVNSAMLKQEIRDKKKYLTQENEVLERNISKLKKDLETFSNGRYLSTTNKTVHFDSKDNYFRLYFVPPQQQADKLASIYQEYRKLQKEEGRIQRKIDKISSQQSNHNFFRATSNKRKEITGSDDELNNNNTTLKISRSNN